MSQILAEPLVFGFFGLLIGSFLNVVIYRLPVMLHRNWQEESIHFLKSEGIAVQSPDDNSKEIAHKQPFNLMTPRSRCQNCGHAISPWENIPVFSYLLLGGKCSSCKAKISIRYPLIELTTAISFMFCGYQWGIGLEAIAWCFFFSCLITLIMIDWDTTLLPDNITLPLLWAGLLLSLTGIIDTSLEDALWGAMFGYLSLWFIYWVFKLLTKKEGMGHGDFKFLAALGAWLGFQAILPILLASSVIGAGFGIFLKIRNHLREGGYMPYGPFLGGAGMFVAVTGTQWFYQFP